MDRAMFVRNMKLYETLPRRDAARVIGAVTGDSRLRRHRNSGARAAARPRPGARRSPTARATLSRRAARRTAPEFLALDAKQITAYLSVIVFMCMNRRR